MEKAVHEVPLIKPWEHRVGTGFVGGTCEVRMVYPHLFIQVLLSSILFPRQICLCVYRNIKIAKLSETAVVPFLS